MDKKWYVVHTYSGYENRVKQNLEKRVESMEMTDYIFRVVVAEEESTTVTKSGVKKKVKKKVFPGYVLVEMIMTDESWYVVRNTPNVTGFVGSTRVGAKPNPLLDEEVTFILSEMGYDDPKKKLLFAVDDLVKVIEGPFAEQEAKVVSIDPENMTLTVSMELFGRVVPADLQFTNVEKLH